MCRNHESGVESHEQPVERNGEREKERKTHKRGRWYNKDTLINVFLESLLPWPFEQLHVCRTVTVEGRLFSATSTILSALAEEQAPSAMLSLPVLLNLDTSTAATPLRSRLKPNSRVTPPISMLCLWNSRQKTQNIMTMDTLNSTRSTCAVGLSSFTKVRRWTQCHHIGRYISPSGREWTPGWPCHWSTHPHRYFQPDGNERNFEQHQWIGSRFSGRGIGRVVSSLPSTPMICFGTSINDIPTLDGPAACWVAWPVHSCQKANKLN